MNLTHIILFHDRSKKLITTLEYEEYRLGRKRGARGITLNDGCDYAFSTIAKVLTIDQFYQQYPAERPVEVPISKNLPTFDEVLNESPNRIKALKQTIVGLKRYIASTEDNPITDSRGFKYWYQGTQKPIEMLKQLENKLAEVKAK